MRMTSEVLVGRGAVCHCCLFEAAGLESSAQRSWWWWWWWCCCDKSARLEVLDKNEPTALDDLPPAPSRSLGERSQHLAASMLVLESEDLVG